MEHVTLLDVSLLQTSLRVSREEVPSGGASPPLSGRRPAISQFPRTAAVHGQEQASWLWGAVRSCRAALDKLLEGSSPAHASSSVALSSVASRALALALDPPRGPFGGVPVLLIFMLAFVIGLVFVIQVVGWSMEGKDPGDFGRQRPEKLLGAPLPGYASSALLPMTSERGFERGLGTPSRPGSTTSALPPSGSPSLSHGEDADRTDAICPALILPHGEARFTIPAESVRRLALGEYPVEILGPSGRPLLHARLPAEPVGGVSTSLGPGRWLELTTTPTSRYPHACVGPLLLGSRSSQPLQIRGPRGDAYGILEAREGAWCAQHGGRVVLRIESLPEGGLQASGADFNVIAMASPNGGQALQVQVNPGVDALLTLLCMLAVVLISPDLAGWRM